MGIAYYPTQTVETVLVGTDATAIGASFFIIKRRWYCLCKWISYKL